MARKTKRCPKQCKKHSFLLKPVHYSAAFSRELSASFCPATLRALSITPKFNKDNHHYTISFILPSQHKKLKGNEEYYKTEHEKCRLENGQEKSKLYIAKPRSKSSYCSVCKDDYEDYLQHIKGENHKEIIKSNRFNDFIEEMSIEMKKKQNNEEIKLEQTRFQHYSQTNIPFFTQENTHFEEKSPFEHHNDYLKGFEYKQINDLLHSAKNFQLLHQHYENIGSQIEAENQGDVQVSKNQKIRRGLQFGQGRMTTNIKPIIIGGMRKNNTFNE